MSEKTNLKLLSDVFQKFEDVRQFKYFDDKKTKGLVYFHSTSAAIKILCLFKNIKLKDKKIKITFADNVDEIEELDIFKFSKKAKSKIPGTGDNFTSVQNLDDIYDLDIDLMLKKSYSNLD